jgi:hypothetical protein
LLQPLQEVAAEPVDFLHGEQVAVADVRQRGQQGGPVVGGELAADLLLEHLGVPLTNVSPGSNEHDFPW